MTRKGHRLGGSRTFELCPLGGKDHSTCGFSDRWIRFSSAIHVFIKHCYERQVQLYDVLLVQHAKAGCQQLTIELEDLKQFKMDIIGDDCETSLVSIALNCLDKG
jgi:hypothetical protein